MPEKVKEEVSKQFLDVARALGLTEIPEFQTYVRTGELPEGFEEEMAKMTQEEANAIIYRRLGLEPPRQLSWIERAYRWLKRVLTKDLLEGMGDKQ